MVTYKLSLDHNQRLGYDERGHREKKQSRFEQFDKKSQKTTNTVESDKYSRDGQLQEVTVDWAAKTLISYKLADKVHAVLGAGKEATVLLASNNDHFLCAKIYRYFTSTNEKRLQAIYDPHIHHDDIASIVAKREYNNLVKMYEADIPVPKPLHCIDNIILMEYIKLDEKNNTPAPMLHEIAIEEFIDPTEALHESIDILANMFLRAKAIHGDYSEHNLMFTEDRGLVTMDVSQSMEYNCNTFTDTQTRIRIDRALKYLQTDIKNINNYFLKKHKVGIDQQEVRESIFDQLPAKIKEMKENRERLFSPQKTINALSSTRIRVDYTARANIVMGTSGYDLNCLREKYITSSFEDTE
jgi:RIO kinase 1